MNKTKIDWCHAVWNPVWGCTKGCSYCYAKKMAKRMHLMMYNKEEKFRIKNGISFIEDNLLHNLVHFNPVFIHSQLERKWSKKDKLIFVNSMSDIADWKDEWIRLVLNRCDDPINKDKIFLFLTKRPQIYFNNIWQRASKNCWFGVTATTRKEILSYRPCKIRRHNFLSIEPWLCNDLYGDINKGVELWDILRYYDWIIAGPMTGVPKYSDGWLVDEKQYELLYINCTVNGKPFFTKSAMEQQPWWKKKYSETMVQFPKEFNL